MWVVVFLLVIIFAYFMLKFSKEEILEAPEQECLKVDGRWLNFNNGCADSCSYRRNPQEIICTQAFTYGCECGEDRCWNGKTCEDN